MPKIMVTCGEASGEQHAAAVIKKIKEIYPRTDWEFFGMGSEILARAGVEIIIDSSELTSLGFFEVLRYLPRYRQVLKMLEEVIEERKPDLLFMVDFSGFNLRVAAIGKKKGVPMVNYFAPSAWIWGKWRARKVARRGATVASVFPGERRVYEEAGADVVYVGHPILDMIEPTEELKKGLPELKKRIDSAKPVIGILPGSRRQEVEGLLPAFLQAAGLIAQECPGACFILPRASTISREIIEDIMQKYPGFPEERFHIVDGHSRQVMALSDLLIVASGTATLEAACIGTPMVICYRVSPLTYHLAKILVRGDKKGRKHIGLPNIILEEGVFPELLQEHVNPEEIAGEALRILKNGEIRQNMHKKVEELRGRLGVGGAVERVALLVARKAGVES